MILYATKWENLQLNHLWVTLGNALMGLHPKWIRKLIQKFNSKASGARRPLT